MYSLGTIFKPKYLAIIFLFCLLVLLRFVQRQTKVEKFVDSSLVKAFKIRVGVWYDKNFSSMYNFLFKISSLIPMEIVTYSNRYQPFYELKSREVDMIFTNEKDYYVYWANQQIKKRTIRDYLKREPQIQMLTMAYHLYVHIPADYEKIVQPSDINESTVALSAKDDIGQDYEKDLIQKYKTQIVYKSKDLNDNFKKLNKQYDLMFFIGDHPNKFLSKYSENKDMIMLDVDDFNPSEDFYQQYIFLNKRKINLVYYPKILQNYNSRSKMGSLLIDGSSYMNAYAIKTMLMGLDLMNDSYIYQFMKTYYSAIFDIIAEELTFNNFTKAEMPACRMANRPEMLSIHKGASKFYKKIGSFSDLPDKSCSLIRNKCTEERLASYGDYIRYESI
jgi:hypothetical protein